MDNLVVADGDGFRAVGVQGRELTIGPLRVGIMSAAEGDLPDGGTGLRTKLQISTTLGSSIVMLTPGDEHTIDQVGTLKVVGIQEFDDEDDRKGVGQGAVAMEFRPAQQAQAFWG